jgi:hypothetical protein
LGFIAFWILLTRGSDGFSSGCKSQRRHAKGCEVNQKEKIMPNSRKKFVVKPGSKIRLKRFDPSYHGEHESRKSALPEIAKNRQKMDELQYLMYAEHKHSLLVVLQGLDAGGKDGTVRHVFTGMNPAGCISVGFKQPTPKELAHDFLWRVTRRVSGRSVNPTIRNANIGMITSRRSRICSTRRAPNTLRGSSFLQTTNGLGTWLFHKLLSGRWKKWTCNFPSQL